MRNTVVLFKKLIHSCFASFSTSDALLYRPVALASSPVIENGKINGNVDMPENEGLCFKVDPDNKIDLLYVYLPDDETFYKRALAERKYFMAHYDKTPEFTALVASYNALGFVTRDSLTTDVRAAIARCYEAEEKHRIKQREAEGFVIPEWRNDLPAEAYRGALSDSVFLDFDLQSYLSHGGCHGYIGHSNRTFETDKALEAQCVQMGLTSSQIATFLAHSAGRHFADQLDAVEDVYKYLSDYLPSTL